MHPCDAANNENISDSVIIKSPAPKKNISYDNADNSAETNRYSTRISEVENRDLQSNPLGTYFDFHMNEVISIIRELSLKFIDFGETTMKNDGGLITEISVGVSMWKLTVETKGGKMTFLLRSTVKRNSTQKELGNREDSLRAFINAVEKDYFYAVNKLATETLHELCTINREIYDSTLIINFKIKLEEIVRSFSIKVRNENHLKITFVFSNREHSIRKIESLKPRLCNIGNALLDDIEHAKQMLELKALFSQSPYNLYVEPRYGENMIEYSFSGNMVDKNRTKITLWLTDLSGYMEHGPDNKFSGYLDPPFEKAKIRIQDLRDKLVAQIKEREAAVIRNAQKSSTIVINTTFPYENERADISCAIAAKLDNVFHGLSGELSASDGQYECDNMVQIWRALVLEMCEYASKIVSVNRERITITSEGWERILKKYSEHICTQESTKRYLAHLERLFKMFDEISGEDYQFSHTFHNTCRVILATEIDCKFCLNLEKFRKNTRALFPPSCRKKKT